MTPQEGYDKLVQIIEFDLRPANYDIVKDIAKELSIYNAKEAKGQKEKLEQFRKTEDKDQLDLRLRLSGTATSDAIAPVYSYVEQIWRTDGVSRKIDGSKEVPETVTQSINGFLSEFYDGSDIHRYCFERVLKYTKIDPNSWTVFNTKFEIGPRGENTVSKVYPVEVRSHDVRDITKDESGVLNCFAFEFKRVVRNINKTKNTKILSDFYLYGIGFNIHFAEFEPEYIDKDYESMGYSVARNINSTKSFYYKIATNTLKEVPAIKWGSYHHEEYEQVCVPLVWDAKPILDMMIKDNSLMQMVKYLHAFPKLSEYVSRCKARNESGLECISGYYGGHRTKDNICKNCNGTGAILVSSEIDIKRFTFPEKGNDLLDLSKTSHYHERPIDIWKEYRSTIREHSRRIQTAIFSQERIDPGQLTQAETATQHKIEFEKIYNTLYPIAELIAKSWSLAVRISYQSFGYEVKPSMTYPFDFKMKSIEDLIDERKKMVDAQAPYDVVNNLDIDILKKQSRNDPTSLAETLAFQRWKPWKDKSVDEVAFIVSMRSNDDLDKVLWENFTQIVDLIKMDFEGDGDFASTEEKQQRKIIYEKTTQFLEGISYKTEQNLFVDLGEDDE